MDIKYEYQKLGRETLNSDNFAHFMEVAKEISKHYYESKKLNVKQVHVKIQNGMQVKNVYNEQYQSEQIFMIIFYHRYANMINKMKTSAEIGSNIKTLNFLVPAHYNPEDNKISYQLNIIMSKKSDNFATLMEMCLHENRYPQQFKSFSIDNPADMINFDPNSIFIIKDYLVMQNVNYPNNHINSLMEIDANLYARGISKYLTTNYFMEHKEDLKTTDYALKERITGNPFDELSEDGLVLGEYLLENGEKVDRAIMLDKNLKNIISQQLVEKYPILKLIWKDGNFKTYEKIMEDKQTLLKTVSDKKHETIESPGYNIEYLTEKEKVEKLYDAIIRSDPMLYLESLLSQKDINFLKVKELFSLHPTLLNEYKIQIEEIFSRKTAKINDNQMHLFNRLSSELNINLQSASIQNMQVKENSSNKVQNGGINRIDKTLPSVKGKTEKKKDDKSNNLPDLAEFIEFISPELINDSKFLALLRKYSGLFYDMTPEEYVEYMEWRYQDLNDSKEKPNIELVDKTEDTIR